MHFSGRNCWSCYGLVVVVLDICRFRLAECHCVDLGECDRPELDLSVRVLDSQVRDWRSILTSRPVDSFNREEASGFGYLNMQYLCLVIDGSLLLQAVAQFFVSGLEEHVVRPLFG